MSGAEPDVPAGDAGAGASPGEPPEPQGRSGARDLPVDRRVTPEALAAYAAPRAGSRFPVGAVALGALVSWLALPAWAFVVVFFLSGSPMPTLDGPELETWGVFVVAVLLFSALPAALLGIPLGAVLVRLLRGVHHPVWHLVAFLAAGAAVGLLVVAIIGDGQFAVMIPPAALAAATGWLVVRRRLITSKPA